MRHALLTTYLFVQHHMLRKADLHHLINLEHARDTLKQTRLRQALLRVRPLVFGTSPPGAVSSSSSCFPSMFPTSRQLRRYPRRGTLYAMHPPELRRDGRGQGQLISVRRLACPHRCSRSCPRISQSASMPHAFPLQTQSRWPTSSSRRTLPSQQSGAFTTHTV
jgi:hypothetical protein